uniref:Uncharacterized protein n=1 Tax=Pseudomonas fluorescens (strain SBW25) TaxID=216595 RepID=A0A0G4E525_PSEFS|nr:hypothetical protein [Pseudomonas fluorescens]CEK42330.1 hypothetical protein PQBR57_0377 [Pseudomonas fluorescens SBW25]
MSRVLKALLALVIVISLGAMILLKVNGQSVEHTSLLPEVFSLMFMLVVLITCIGVMRAMYKREI